MGSVWMSDEIELKTLLQRCYALALSVKTADDAGDIQITDEQREAAVDLLRDLPTAIKSQKKRD